MRVHSYCLGEHNGLVRVETRTGSAALGSWHGVVADSLGRVVELDLIHGIPDATAWRR